MTTKKETLEQRAACSRADAKRLEAELAAGIDPGVGGISPRRGKVSPRVAAARAIATLAMKHPGVELEQRSDTLEK
jgi:hypothetical protein